MTDLFFWQLTDLMKLSKMAYFMAEILDYFLATVTVGV